MSAASSASADEKSQGARAAGSVTGSGTASAAVGQPKDPSAKEASNDSADAGDDDDDAEDSSLAATGATASGTAALATRTALTPPIAATLATPTARQPLASDASAANAGPDANADATPDAGAGMLHAAAGPQTGPAALPIKLDDQTSVQQDSSSDVQQNSGDPNSAAASASLTSTVTPTAHAQSAASDAQPVHASVGSDAWGTELGTRLTLMAQQGMSSASLRLSPAHLGPLEVRISVHEGSASVFFGATQSDTRAALEQALPRLREMFASHGLNLANAGVSGETPRGTPQNPQPSGNGRGEATREGSAMPLAASISTHQGLIDTYA